MERPNPLGNAANRVGALWALMASGVSGLLAFVGLSAMQAHAIMAVGDSLPLLITLVGTLIAAVMPLVSGLVSSYRTVAAARDHVTPMLDPRDNDGNALVPVIRAGIVQ